MATSVHYNHRRPLSAFAKTVAVKRSAQTVIFGTSRKRTSSVTDPITTAVFASLPSRAKNFAMDLIEIGGRLVREAKRRFSTTLLNFASVRRARKRYSLTSSRRYRFSETGAVRPDFLVALRPPATISIPITNLPRTAGSGAHPREHGEGGPST